MINRTIQAIELPIRNDLAATDSALPKQSLHLHSPRGPAIRAQQQARMFGRWCQWRSSYSGSLAKPCTLKIEPHKLLFLSTSSRDGPNNARHRRYDPTTKRPNSVCDPYGQGGKPMSAADAQSHMPTIHENWELVTNRTTNENDDQTSSPPPPDLLQREFRHEDFLTGAKFLKKIAAVALVNNHFPLLELDRKIVKNQWLNISRISCRTKVLGGLSTNDFFLAMVSSCPTNLYFQL